MSKKDNGGPAFPEVVTEYKGVPGAYRQEVYSVGGMSLRDYFAAHAPLDTLKFESAEAMADFSGCPIPTSNAELVAVGMTCAAKAAYMYADAMLKARKQ